MTDNESSMVLVKLIIVLAKNMKMHSIAEGVERMEEARILSELGCDMVQGHHIAKPEPNEWQFDYSFQGIFDCPIILAGRPPYNIGPRLGEAVPIGRFLSFASC